MTLETEAGQAAAGVATEATTTVAAQTNAATTEAGTGSAEGGEQQGQAAEKTFTQAELDDIVQKRVAKAEAKAERRVLRTLERVIPQPQGQRAAPTEPPANAAPRRDQYASDEEYLDAKVDWKLAQREQASAQQRQKEQSDRLAQTTDQIYAKAAKLPGFDREAFDELPLTKPIVEALVESDQAPQLMAYMAGHPDEVARIAGLSAGRQAAELGKLEAKIAATPPVKTSKAPDPITPIGSGKTPVHSLQTADMDTYIAERKKQGARWAR